MIEAKGQWYALRAFKEIKKNIPNAKLVLIGDGEYYSKLIRLSSILKNTNNFDFVLETTRGKIQQQLEVIYDELKSKIEKKQGLIKKSLLWSIIT